MIYAHCAMSIPYSIVTAHPDGRRPYGRLVTGCTTGDKLDEKLTAELVDFVMDARDSKITSLAAFYEDYYDEYYMDMPPFEAQYFRDGVWHSWEPDEEQFMKQYLSAWGT